MSYNVTHAEYLGGGLSIKRRAARGFYRSRNERLPEGSFLEDLELDEGDGDEDLAIENFAWHGEMSGTAYHETLDRLLSLTTGEATILFVWEGGDRLSALHVKDGVVTEKKVRVVVDE